LLRAMHEWISDSNQTPHIVVDASMEGVEVPRQYVQGGKIILNVSSNATSMLSLGNDIVRFRARFGAATYDVSVPIGAVLGIYARETGPPSEPAPTSSENKRTKPTLKVIK
jgi:stringent starvation protein B